MSTDVAFLGEQNAQLPGFLAESKDVGLGNENVGADDQQIPRLNLLQALSPQLDDVEGAKAGLFHNSVTDELYPNVAVINLFYKKEFTIWRKRNKGGGYCGAYETNDAATAHVESLPGSPDDYDIQDTAKHACLLLNSETGEVIQPIMVYLKGSGMTVSRNWNSQINSFNGDHPRFSSIWTLTSIKKTKDQDSWFVVKVSDGSWVPSEKLYNTAKEFYETIKGSI